MIHFHERSIMTTREFVEALAHLLARGLIEVDESLERDDDGWPRFRPTPAGLKEIADPAAYDLTHDPRD